MNSVESMGWIVVVIAVSSLVQAVFLITMAMTLIKVLRKVEVLSDRIDREVKPTLDQVSRITRNVAEVSDLATLQARRLHLFVGDTVDKLEMVTANVESMLRPRGPLADLMAVIRGLRAGFEAYRQLGGHEPAGGRTVPRRGPLEDDEHLFI